MLHKPNHAHQDNLWLPLSEENSSTFLCQARLGSWPQTLDPLLTPRFPWATASVRVEEGHLRLVRLCLPCGAALRETGSWPLRQPERGKNVVPSILSNSSATPKGHRPSPPVVYAPQQTLLHASNHSTFIIWFNPRPSFPPFFPVTPSRWEGWGRRALGQELPRRLYLPAEAGMLRGCPHMAAPGMSHPALRRGGVIHIAALKAGALGGEWCVAVQPSEERGRSGFPQRHRPFFVGLPGSPAAVP